MEVRLYSYSQKKTTNQKMDDLSDQFYELMKKSLKESFWMYIVKISQVKGSFYLLIRKSRGKILNQNLKNVIDTVKNISDNFLTSTLKNQMILNINFFQILS